VTAESKEKRRQRLLARADEALGLEQLLADERVQKFFTAAEDVAINKSLSAKPEEDAARLEAVCQLRAARALREHLERTVAAALAARAKLEAMDDE
jgi:pantoate kinase